MYNPTEFHQRMGQPGVCPNLTYDLVSSVGCATLYQALG